LQEIRIVYQNGQESKKREYTVYDKKDTWNTPCHKKHEKENTVNYRKDDTIRPENKKDGFLFLLEKKEKNTHNGSRKKKRDRVEYL